MTKITREEMLAWIKTAESMFSERYNDLSYLQAIRDELMKTEKLVETLRFYAGNDLHSFMGICIEGFRIGKDSNSQIGIPAGEKARQALAEYEEEKETISKKETVQEVSQVEKFAAYYSGRTDWSARHFLEFAEDLKYDIMKELKK